MLSSILAGLLLCFCQYVWAKKQPNILFILTGELQLESSSGHEPRTDSNPDDQDWHMQSLAHMPLVQKYLINEGTLYSRHFCTVALCCPSRVNLWTGRAAHNTVRQLTIL